MKLLLLLSISQILFIAFAEAGPLTSGGGNAVVCFDSPAIPNAIRDPQSTRFGKILDDEVTSHITSVEAYDLYEARMERGLEGSQRPQIIEISDVESIRDYSEKIAKRFEPFFPMISETIRFGNKAFVDTNIILRPSGLTLIHDENDVGYIDALNCVVATMATQYSVGSKIFLQLDQRLFQHRLHSKLSQAVLFLHESIYYAARLFSKHEDSRNTRILIGAILDQAPVDSIWILGLYNSLNMPYNKSFMESWFDKLYNFDKSPLDDRLYDVIVKDKYLELGIDMEISKVIRRFNQWQTKSPISTSLNSESQYDKILHRLYNFYDGDEKEVCSKFNREKCSSEHQVILLDTKKLVAIMENANTMAFKDYSKKLESVFLAELESLSQFDATTKRNFGELLKLYANKNAEYFKSAYGGSLWLQRKVDFNSVRFFIP